MSTPNISPLRSCRTPLTPSQSKIQIQARQQKIKESSERIKSIRNFKEELKSSQDFIKKQKQIELSQAKEKIKAIKSIKSIKSSKRIEGIRQFKTFSISYPKEVKVLALKHHFQWINEVEKKMKDMEDQENRLINELSRACGISLKTASNKGSLTARSNL